VTFYSVIFSVPQHLRHHSTCRKPGPHVTQASTLNSYVFLAAVFATPVFGYCWIGLGRNALLLACGSVLLPLSFLVLGASRSAGLSTALLGVSFFLPARGAMADRCALFRTGAPRHRPTCMTTLQNVGLLERTSSPGTFSTT